MEYKAGKQPFFQLLAMSVELEGFEPSSKRGNHKFSTCLVLTWFSTTGRLGTTNLWLSL